MELLVRLVDHINRIVDEVDVMIINIVNDNDVLSLVSSQIDGQMESGKLSTGQEIEPPYAPFTIEMKELAGDPWDRVTLKNTGKFRKEIYAEVQNDGIQTGSHDSKADMLINGFEIPSGFHPGYGPDIFGITQENKNILKESLLPRAQKWTLDYAKSIIQ